MSPELAKLLGIDERRSVRLSQLIAETMKRHPSDRHHFASHLTGKLEDPNHKACLPDLEDLCASVMRNFTRDEVQFLIDEISPDDEEMKMLVFMAALQNLFGMGRKPQ